MSKPSLLLIGNGRLSQHLQHYFSHLHINYHLWFRGTSSSKSLVNYLNQSDICLLAISDRALSSFLADHSEILFNKRVVHFSGALYFDKAIGAHPLMTFSQKLYDLETYFHIPFAIDRPQFRLADLIPGLENPSFYIQPQMKPLYHAYCSFSGNLSQLLWLWTKKAFEQELGVSANYLRAYQRQIFSNLQNEDNPLTGPLVRGDTLTLNMHLSALPDPLSQIYQDFVDAYSKLNLKGDICESRSLSNE